MATDKQDDVILNNWHRAFLIGYGFILGLGAGALLVAFVTG